MFAVNQSNSCPYFSFDALEAPQPDEASSELCATLEVLRECASTKTDVLPPEYPIFLRCVRTAISRGRLVLFASSIDAGRRSARVQRGRPLVFDGVQHLEKSMITSTDRRNFIGGASVSGLPRCLKCEDHNHRTA